MEPQHRKTQPRPGAGSTGSSGHQRCAMRMLDDPRRGKILVYETEPLPGTEESATLVFETDSWCARLRQYPADWCRLRAEALIVLGLTSH